MPSLPPLFFDLDGTLADSAGGIASSLDHAIRTVIGAHSVEDWRPFIGPPVEVCVARALPNLDSALIPVVVREFRRHYDSEGLRMTTAYPDAHDVLAALAAMGCRSYIVTNKPFHAASAVVAHLGLDRHVRRIVGGDTDFGAGARPEDSKADRAARLSVEEGLRGGIFVGDGLDDLHAAERVGARFLLAAWGYGTAGVLAERPTAEPLGRLSDLVSRIAAGDAATG
jgi:phosphoglycolate phosphatase